MIKHPDIIFTQTREISQEGYGIEYKQKMHAMLSDTDTYVIVKKNSSKTLTNNLRELFMR